MNTEIENTSKQNRQQNKNTKYKQREIKTVYSDAQITKNIVTLYDYEEELNESRRQIKLLNNTYAGEMERQLKVLMKVA